MNMSVSEGPLSPDSSGSPEPPSQKRYFNPSKLQGSTQSQVSQSSLVPRKVNPPFEKKSTFFTEFIFFKEFGPDE